MSRTIHMTRAGKPKLAAGNVPDFFSRRSVRVNRRVLRFESLEPRHLLAAGALIGVDFDNPGGSVPTNWSQFGGFSIPALASNLIDEDGQATVVDLAITRVGFQVGTVGTLPNASTIPTYTQSLAGLSGLAF